MILNFKDSTNSTALTYEGELTKYYRITNEKKCCYFYARMRMKLIIAFYSISGHVTSVFTRWRYVNFNPGGINEGVTVLSKLLL